MQYDRARGKSDNSPKDIQIRDATREDVPDIVRLYAEDDRALHDSAPCSNSFDRYEAAFDNVWRDGRNRLIVACESELIVGTYQMTFIPYLLDGGSERAMIEAMFVSSAWRGKGVGNALIHHAKALATLRGCNLVQLTCNRSRINTREFYTSLGFEGTHIGFKQDLTTA